MKGKKTLFVLGLIFVSMNFLFFYLKEIKVSYFLKKIPTLYLQAQMETTDSNKIYNPFYLMSLDTREESLFSGKKGYGPWIETPFGNMRLISCTSGTKNLQQLFTAVQIRIKPNWYILRPEMTPQTFPFTPYKLLFPFTPSYKYTNSVYFPIIFYDLPKVSPLNILVISKITACFNEFCSSFSIPVTLELLHQENYPTPICSNMLFNSGIFPKENNGAFSTNVQRKENIALVSFSFYKKTALPTIFSEEKSILITPLSFEDNQSSFLFSNIPPHLSELNITLRTNEDYFYEKIKLPETQKNFQLNLPSSQNTPPTPFSFIFIQDSFCLECSISKFKIKTSLSTYPLFDQKKLSIKTLLSPKKNATPQAFFFAPKLPFGIKIPTSLSYKDIHHLITLFR